MAINGLKKVLSLPAVTFIAIGTTIGGGIFVFTGIVLKIAGPALPAAYALAVIPVFLSMLPLVMLGSALPVTGGNYIYPSRMVSPGLAFTGIWVYVLATFFGQVPLYSIACARYASVLLPGLNVEIFAIGLVTFFCVINILGVRPAAQIQGVMVLILIAALVYFGISGTVPPRPERFADMFQMGAGGLFLGVALLTFTYLGSNCIIELGDEIRDPGRVIPRALFIAFPVVTAVYLLVAFAAVNAVPWQSIAGVDEPLIGAARAVMGPAGLLFFVLGGAVLALTTTLNGLFIVGTKSLLVIIDDGLLPKSLGAVNRRFGTAHALFILIWIVSIVGVLSGLSLETFASYAALGGIIIFIPVLIASLGLPRRFPEAYAAPGFRLRGAWLYICPAVGIAVSLFFSIVILSQLKTAANIILFLFFILSGFLYYAARKRRLRGMGVNLDDLVKNTDWTGK
jgi:APA family basic amino acid/polyamine antiporter